MVGLVATAKAGHDKNQMYIIIEERDEYVLLTDGKIRTINHPKHKNKKHIQIWKKEIPLLTEVKKKLNNHEEVRDEEIKRIIKLLRNDQVSTQAK